jgi:peptidoglycan/LPS O-acetylase OafA/YrhL
LVVAVSFFHFQMTGSISPFFPVTPATLFEHAFFIRGISVLWSIPVEVQFYVLFPLFWFAYSRSGDTALLWAGLAICTVAFLGFPQTPDVGFYLPFFLTGVICSRINPKIGNGMNAVFVVAMVGYVYCWPEISGLRGIWTAMQYPILMAVIVLSTANSRWASITLGHPIARYFGKISYSVYLWHLPVLLAYEDLGLVPDNKAPFVGIYLVSVTIAASISFYLFEDPMRRLIYGERPIWKSPLELPDHQGSTTAGNSVRNSATVG